MTSKRRTNQDTTGVLSLHFWLCHGNSATSEQQQLQQRLTPDTAALEMLTILSLIYG